MFCDIDQMNCRPLTIKLTENAEPYSVRTARNTPFSLNGEENAGLQCILEEGITEPTFSYTQKKCIKSVLSPSLAASGWIAGSRVARLDVSM